MKFFFFLSKWPPDTFSKTTGRPMNFQGELPVFCFNGPHNFSFILYTEMKKISYFSYENVRLALITL